MPVRQSAKAPSAAIDAPLSTARVQVWRHKSVVGIIRVYAPTPVDAYVLDADDLAVFRKRAQQQEPKTRAFSQYVYHAGRCRVHRCGRALRCASPPRASCSALQKARKSGGSGNFFDPFAFFLGVHTQTVQ